MKIPRTLIDLYICSLFPHALTPSSLMGAMLLEVKHFFLAQVIGFPSTICLVVVYTLYITNLIEDSSKFFSIILIQMLPSLHT